MLNKSSDYEEPEIIKLIGQNQNIKKRIYKLTSKHIQEILKAQLSRVSQEILECVDIIVFNQQSADIFSQLKENEFIGKIRNVSIESISQQ